MRPKWQNHSSWGISRLGLKLEPMEPLMGTLVINWEPLTENREPLTGTGSHWQWTGDRWLGTMTHWRGPGCGHACDLNGNVHVEHFCENLPCLNRKCLYLSWWPNNIGFLASPRFPSPIIQTSPILVYWFLTKPYGQAALINRRCPGFTPTLSRGGGNAVWAARAPAAPQYW